MNFKWLFKPLQLFPVNRLSRIQIPRETLAVFYDHAPMKAKRGSLQTHIKYNLMLLSCRHNSALIHLLQKLWWIRKSVLSQTHKMPTGFEQWWPEVKLLYWFSWSRGINSMKNAPTSHDTLSHCVFRHSFLWNVNEGLCLLVRGRFFSVCLFITLYILVLYFFSFF